MMKKNYKVCAAVVFMTLFFFSGINANGINTHPYHNGSKNDNEKKQMYNEIENLDLNEIVYIEEEEEINVGFDTYFYLPEGFNPYQGMKISLDDIHYMECEEEIYLDFNVNDFLPKDFDPFMRP